MKTTAITLSLLTAGASAVLAGGLEKERALLKQAIG